jgi:hypothetical protein
MRSYVTIISSFLIFLFIYTATDKLVHLDKNAFVLNQMPMLAGYGKHLALGIPVTEILISLLLVFPATKLKGLYAALALMSVFTIYLLAMLAKGGVMPCSCGGVIAKMSWGQHLAFNIVVTALTGLAIRYGDRSLQNKIT